MTRVYTGNDSDRWITLASASIIAAFGVVTAAYLVDSETDRPIDLGSRLATQESDSTNVQQCQPEDLE